MGGPLFPEVAAVAALGPAVRQAMFDLYARYYEPALPAVFEADLAAKSHAVLLRDRAGVLRGFSTLLSWRVAAPGGQARVIFSGDTIIEQAFWGRQTLPLAWIEHAGTIHAADPKTPLFWLLIAKGHRTYRLMPAFAHDYFPARGRPTPAPVEAMMAQVGAGAFGERFCPETGIVRRAPGGAALKPEFAGPDERRRANADAAFFAARNPGYREGDELLCLCELSPENLRAPARDKFLQGFARGRLEPHP